jgi:hypothetical protein
MGMKPGDKVWVWNALGPKTHQIESGILLEIGYMAYVRLSNRDRPYVFLADEVFPTREALCEHYRKIFE